MQRFYHLVVAPHWRNFAISSDTSFLSCSEVFMRRLSFAVSDNSNKGAQFLVRIAAGLSTGGGSVLLAQPTDVVKIRMQASVNRYSGCVDAYTRIARSEGLRGLWKGTWICLFYLFFSVIFLFH